MPRISGKPNIRLFKSQFHGGPILHVKTIPKRPVWLVFCLPFLLILPAFPQDKPYFVTYSHDLEEPGNLEIETKSAVAQANGGNPFGATAMELEYGTRAWWTTELYLDGQATGSDSTVFTGWRLENRIRPLMRDHAVNPVLYVEYENTSGADKTILEVVGHDGQADLAALNAIAAPRPSARSRTEADSLFQREGLERLGELHLGEKPRP